MYPGPEDPDLGDLVVQVEQALRARGDEVELAVLNRRGGGKRRYASLGLQAFIAAARLRPDVVYAHFLVPSGLLARLASWAPLVVTAHGRDVRNVGAIPGIRSLTRLTVRRAKAVIAVSDYLRRELEAKVPESSANRASSSRSARPCSRRWRAGGQWSRRGSAGRRSSCRLRRGFSSTRSTWRPSRKRSKPPRRCRARTTPHARPPSVTMSPNRRVAWKPSWSEQRARPEVRCSLTGPDAPEDSRAHSGRPSPLRRGAGSLPLERRADRDRRNRTGR